MLDEASSYLRNFTIPVAALICTFITLNIFAQAEDDEKYRIELNSRSWVPVPAISESLEPLVNGPSGFDRFTSWFGQKFAGEPFLTDEMRVGSDKHFLLQFYEPLSPEDFSLLEESGIGLEADLGGNAYYVSKKLDGPMPSDLVTRIRFMDTIPGTDKLDAVVLQELAPSTKGVFPKAFDNVAAFVDEDIEVMVVFFSDVTQDQVNLALENLDLTGELYGAGNSWLVTGSGQQLALLAEFDIVLALTPGRIDYHPLNDSSRAVIGTDDVNGIEFQRPIKFVTGVAGQGVLVAVSDEHSVDEKHRDFRIELKSPPDDTRVFHVRPGAGPHGTYVASIIGGNGQNSVDQNGSQSFLLRGHAPLAQLGDYIQAYGSVSRHANMLLAGNSDLSNHSYAQPDGLRYGATARSLDIMIRGDAVFDDRRIPPKSQVWAAGNNGTKIEQGFQRGFHSVYTTSKNSISVGSVDSVDLHVSSFSSLGPTLDGRIKPDLVAPGCANSVPEPPEGINAAKANSQSYGSICGTSAAAPVVSAIIALMTEVMDDEIGGLPVKPSLFKAILIQTTLDLVHSSPSAAKEFDNPDLGAPVVYFEGPDFATGYGLVQARPAVELAGNNIRLAQATLSRTRETDSYCILVQPEELVKLTLAWDDREAAPNAPITSRKLVNDLDLSVLDEENNSYLPFTLEKLNIGPKSAQQWGDDPIQLADIKPAVPGIDRLNNVEMVSVEARTTGIWQVQVVAFRFGLGGDQIYSLASSHDLQDCS